LSPDLRDARRSEITRFTASDVWKPPGWRHRRHGPVLLAPLALAYVRREYARVGIQIATNWGNLKVNSLDETRVEFAYKGMEGLNLAGLARED
jgi:hypothetical protein